MTPLQIDSIAALPGQKGSGYAHVDTGIAHVRMPLVILNGAQPGPRLALTAGLHYGEFIGIEALSDLLWKITPAALAGQVVACPLACPPSCVTHRTHASPLDGVNPNRVYPGSRTGGPTERLVAWVFEHLIRGSDVFIDLHGGGVTLDLSSFVGFRSSGSPEQDHRAKELASLFGLPIIRGRSADGGNSHAAATRAGIVSLLVEVGAQGSRSPDQVAIVRDGVLRVMHHLGMIKEGPAKPIVGEEHWVWADEVTAPIEGLWYPEFEVGGAIEAGQVLGRILDPLGELLAEMVAPHGGRVFYGERGLSIGCGDVLAAIAARDTP